MQMSQPRQAPMSPIVSTPLPAKPVTLHNRFMKTLPIPATDLEPSAVALGLLRIKSLSDAEIGELYATAREIGINMFDLADIYGGKRHGAEERFGEAITLTPSEREKVIIQTKCGIGNGFYDSSREHILRSVEGSLGALKVDYLDLLLLHRPDTLVEPEEVAEAFDRLHAEGQVRHFGVSNHTPGQIELLKRHVRQPLVVDQVQLSIAHAPLFAHGLAANMARSVQSPDRDNDLLNYARLHDIRLQAWSPFQNEAGKDVFIGDRENYRELNDEIERLATKYSVTPNALPVAWISRHPAGIQVLVGTTRPDRLKEAAAGANVALEREEWYRLFSAAGYTVP